jgi:hypothetical protein
MAVVKAISTTRHGAASSVRSIVERAPYRSAKAPQNGPATAVISGEIPSAMPDQSAAATGSPSTSERMKRGMNGVTRSQAVLLVAATTSRARRLRSCIVRSRASGRSGAEPPDRRAPDRRRPHERSFSIRSQASSSCSRPRG